MSENLHCSTVSSATKRQLPKIPPGGDERRAITESLTTGGEILSSSIREVLNPQKKTVFSPLIERQIRTSLDESDMVVFVLDGKEGILPEDRDVAARSSEERKNRFFYAVNKADSNKREENLVEFYELGVKKLYPVSALHGRGVDELLEDIVEAARHIDADIHEPESEGAMKIAFVGRPNTGKSFPDEQNTRFGEDDCQRCPRHYKGCYRDSQIAVKGKRIILIDTAGLRKKSKISMKVEEYSVSSAIRSIERAHVVNLVVDGQEGIGHQEGSIASLIISRGKGLCVVVNKWDLMDSTAKQDEYKRLVREKIPHAAFAPVVLVSAKTGKNVTNILQHNFRVYEQLTRRISTSEINDAFEEFFGRLSISFQKGRQVKIFYVSQAKTSPPTFVLFSNHPELVPEHYKRYLENSIRGKFGFSGAPIRLVFKKK